MTVEAMPNRTRNVRTMMMLALAAPPLAWVVISAAWLALAAAAPRAFDGRTMSLAETMAVSSYADAERLLRSGADPNVPARLRPGIVDLHPHTMTPLEAATAAVRTGPVQMLVEHGAVINEENYAVLWCAARARRNQDMLQFLQARSPTHASIECSMIRRLW